MKNKAIYNHIIKNASVRTIASLLLPDAEIIRLYDHYPEPAVVWWEGSVPLSRSGPNRQMHIQAMHFDVEMPKSTFIDALDEIEKTRGGLTLLQSYDPLPGTIHPRGFQKSETRLQVFAQCGVCLYVELPYVDETAAVAIFGENHLNTLLRKGVIAIDDSGCMAVKKS